MDPSAIAGLLLNGGVGLYQMITGGQQKDQLNAAMKANVMPKYNIPPEEYYAQQLAQSRAGSGMSDEAREAYGQQSKQGLASTISGAEHGGADINTLPVAYGGYEAGQRNLALNDDATRLSNLKQLYDQNARMTAQKTTAYQLNEYAPWANKQQALAQQLAGAATMQNAGLNTLASAGTGLLGAGAKAAFGGGSSTPPPTKQISTTPAIPGNPNSPELPPSFDWGNSASPVLPNNQPATVNPMDDWYMGGGNDAATNFNNYKRDSLMFNK